MNSVALYPELENFFINRLRTIPCSENTKSYIIGILVKYRSSHLDLSKNSITIEYALAKSNSDFLRFQTLADWLFFSKSIYPESLKNASEDYYNSIAQISYYSCFRLINKKWSLYEEISDQFPILTTTVNQAIRHT